MKQFKFTILLIAASILLCACPKDENGHRDIAFVNNSEREIACQEIFGDGESTNSDTLFHCRMSAIGIHANSSYIFECDEYASGWEVEFKNIPYLQLLVMDAETYDKYIAEPCDTIRKYVPVLHIYRLTLSDLQRMNWTVIYPPEE
jgi:hypothetical protein